MKPAKPWRPKPIRPTLAGDLSHEAKVGYWVRNEALRKIGFPDYPSYLASELWRKIREYILRREPKCRFCPDRATQVHHHYYHLEVLLGEDDRYLIPVCRGCHEYGEVLPGGGKAAPWQATERMAARGRDAVLAALRAARPGNTG